MGKRPITNKMSLYDNCLVNGIKMYELWVICNLFRFRDISVQRMLVLLSYRIESPSRFLKNSLGFRDNQARTDDFHHVKVALYR